MVDKPDCKLPTSLFLPANPERKGEGGLRTKGYFKHSYKRVGKNWHICDTEGNPVFLCPSDIVTQISSYIDALKKRELSSVLDPNSISEIPLVSIVTVVKNAKNWIKNTILSVVNQNYPNIEYIIIDGNSTDGTRDILMDYDRFVDYWISETDNGIYDAMNKGTFLSTGRWLLYLNAGDFLYSDRVIEKIVTFKYANSTIDEASEALIYGDWVSFFSGYSFLFRPLHLKNLRTRMCFAHSACLFKSEVVKKYGYQTNYLIASDYELIRHLWSRGYKFVYANTVISCVNCQDGLSQSFVWTGFKERLRIASAQEKKSLPNTFLRYFIMDFFSAIFSKVFRFDLFGSRTSPIFRYLIRRLRYGQTHPSC
ncbi:MAG: glycosyltransferase family 2 protein [Deltaproteobacteria bacterium]|nr:glycosyltransferase family 2 protein [Deltaproteobacteria bacterium]